MRALLIFTAACWTGSGSPPAKGSSVPASGIVASYDMSTRTAGGMLLDTGPYELHGKIKTSVLRPGPLDYAREFRTVADKVELPSSPHFALDGPLTLAVWARIDQLGLHQHLVACDDKFALWVTPENRLRFSDTLGHGMDTKAPLDDNHWYSIVAVNRGTKGSEIAASLEIYLDGTRVETELVNRGGETPLRWLPGRLYPSDACHIGFESHQGLVDHQ